eukprot:g2083.t1
MTDTKIRIAAGLERAFAENGFAAPSVGDLRDAAGVSLRTLYKYAPSREEMVYAALEHRHRRYLEKVFSDLPANADEALAEIFNRVGTWMETESTRGCLFHAAVAAAPQDQRLIALLQTHKAEVARLAAKKSGLESKEVELMLVLEGLTQTWPQHGALAVDSANKLGAALRGRPSQSATAAA